MQNDNHEAFTHQVGKKKDIGKIAHETLHAT